MEGAPRHRYETLADFVAGLIEAGTLPPGARVPSLRRICALRRVSLSTALHAYRLLEDRGVIEARPQSGFYVAAGGRVALETPGTSRPTGQAIPVAVTGVVLRLLELAGDDRHVPLGCAIPDALLLGSGRLDRCLARAARVKGHVYNVYSHPKGDPRLRQEIARRALRWGQGLSPEDIIVTCGCTEALSLALQSVTRPGDTVAIESPTYFGLLQVLEAQGLKALELSTSARVGVDPASLERALAGGSVAACLLSSSFNNPLGATTPEPHKRDILALLARHGVPLIEDDIYGDIHFGEERPRPFTALDDSGNTLYCSSFSKTLAPGYRIGWLAAGRHAQRALERKFAATLCGPALPQAALADFLASGGYDSHLRRLRRRFADNVERASRVVARAFPAGTRVSRPEGGFVLWLDLPEPFRSRALFDRALAEGICFAPGDVFSPGGLYNNCLRLSCGHSWGARIEAGIERLGALATEMLDAVPDGAAEPALPGNRSRED